MDWARILLAAVLVAQIGCHREQGPAMQGTPFDDPQLLSLDFSAPFTAFDGGDGSLMRGTGWSMPERASFGLESVQSFAWAVDGEAVLWVERPPGQELELYAQCRAFWWDEATPQELTVVVDGRAVGSASVGKDWQVVRIPLSAAALGPGLNEIRLRFLRSTRPLDVGKTKDARRLCAAFRFLALVPRGLADPAEVAARAREYHSTGLLALGPGTEAGLPMPAGQHAELALGRVTSDCAGPRLSLELRSAGGEARPIWSGKATAASRLRAKFDIPSDRPSRLFFAVSPGVGDAAPQCRVRLDLSRGPVRGSPRVAGEQPSRPHVFVYLVDTLRADSLAPYGGESRATPEVAAFARDSVTYARAWSASSWTLPAVVSLLTGVYPSRHRIMRGDVKYSETTARSLASVLAELGYDTVGVSHSLIASPAFGLDRGFGRYFFSDQLNGWEPRSQELRRPLYQWLLERTTGSRPVFAYLHAVDPHAPYLPPRELAGEFEGSYPERGDPSCLPVTFTLKSEPEPGAVERLHRLYQGEVVFADREFGRFVAMLKHLGLYDDSVIVFVGDHGEEFGEHGAFDHGRTLYEELLHVPLLVKYPGSEWAGTRVEQRVSLVDVVPTVLEAIGARDFGLETDGHSLLPLSSGGSPGLEPRALWAEVNPEPSEHLASVSYRALLRGSHKCIENLLEIDQRQRPAPRWQIFDLGADPAEHRPLPDDSAEAQECMTLLTGSTSLAGATASPPAPSEVIDPATLEKLRELGYAR